MSRDERSPRSGTLVAATAAALTVAIGLTVSSLTGQLDAPGPSADETAATPDVVLVPVERAAEPAPAWDDEDDGNEEVRHGERERDDDEEHEEHERRGHREHEDDD